jgi:hypothetical protein
MKAHAAAASPLAGRVQAAHLWQGSSNDCGPYSAAMVINALTPNPVDPAALAREMDRVAWRGVLPVIRRVPQWATMPWGVADILRRNGVPAVWKPLRTEADLIALLESGRIPIVIVGAWRPMWGHVMVLLAWDPVQGWGFADPAWPDASLHWFDPPRFARLWRTYGRVVIVANPSHPTI